MPFDALSGRTPNWWPPRGKPRIQGVEIDPEGRLRRGLISCLLFQPGPWQRNLLQPQMTFTQGGSGSVSYADGQFGGNVTTSSNTYLMLSLPPQTPGAWTESCLMRFNGTNPLDACFVGSDGAGDNYFIINGPSAITPGSVTFNGNNAGVGGFLAVNFSGWHRITCTASANTGTGTFYLDGRLVGTQSILLGVSQFGALFGDSSRSCIFTNFPIADHFLWNVELTPAQVMQHYGQPYRSVLRPRFSELGRIGTRPNGRRPSLMTTGVGP